LSFRVAPAGPGLGCDRQLQDPARLACHQVGEFIDAAKAVRHFAYDLIVHVQHDRVTGGFNPQHRVGEQIAGDAGDDVLSPHATICAVAVPAVFELSGSVIGEDDNLVLCVFDLDMGLRVSKLAATWQFQEQECAGAFESNTAAGNYAAALTHRSPSSAIGVVPKLLDLRM